MNRRNALAALTAFMVSAICARAQAQSYNPVVIVSGDASHQIGTWMGITNAGVVVGNRAAADGSPLPPFRWTPTSPNGSTGTLSLLPTFGGPGGRVYDVNTNGACAGMAQKPSGQSYAAYWTASGSIVSLGTNCFAWGLNDATSPLIVGWVHGSRNNYSPAYYRGGKWYSLPTLGGNGVAYRVDNDNRIVGICYGSDGSNHVALWAPTSKGYELTDLTATMGLTNVSGEHPTMSKSGLVASDAQILDLNSGTIRTIAMAGAAEIRATSINSSGRVVGSYLVYDDNGNPVPGGSFYYDGTTATDLSLLLPSGSGWGVSGQSINDYSGGLGQIAGVGGDSGSYADAVLLTP